MNDPFGDNFVIGPNGRPQFKESNENNLSHSHGTHNQENTSGVRIQDIDFMDLEQSQEEQNILQENRNKNLMNSYAVGFERKLIQLQQTNLKYSKIGHNNISQYDNNNNQISHHDQSNFVPKITSLDDKAHLHSPIKGLAFYEKKGPEVQFRLSEGRPIKMIVQNENKEYELSEEAIDEISKCPGHVSFISTMGAKKSGKTFLMNTIIESQNSANYQRFKSQEGIILWSQPLYNVLTSSWVFFIDTDLDLTKEIDLKLYFILMILSSTILVNTQGNLSENTLESFRSLLKLRDYIQMQNEQEVNTLINISPSLILLLRDFSLKQTKSSQISQVKYFDDFLFDEISYLRASKDQKKIKQRLIKYFKDKQLVSIEKPANNESDLRNLDNLDPMLLREEFVNDIYYLRKAILSSAKVKEYQGVFFNANMSISFVNSLLEDIRENKKLDINKAFSVLLENEFISEYNQAIELYYNVLGYEFQDSEFKSIEDMQKSLQNAREAATERFYNLRAHDSPNANEKFNKYLNQLLDVIKEKEKNIINVNNDVSGEFMDEFVSNVKNNLNYKADPNKKFTVDDLKEIEQYFVEQLKFVNKKILGEGQQYQLIGQIALNIQNQLIQSFNNELGELESNHKAQLDKENKEMEKINQNINNVKQTIQQLQDEKMQISKDIQQIDEKRKQTERSKEDLTKQIEGLKKLKDQAIQECEQTKKKASVKCGCCTRNLEPFTLKK